MSVRPVSFNPDGSIDVIFDEQGHTGVIPATGIIWVDNPDGTHDHNLIVLNCPDNCGFKSTHPVGGGAAPPEVQSMFVKKTELSGCICGNVPASETSLPESHVRLNCNRMEGPGKWQASDLSDIEKFKSGVPFENSPTMFQVVYRDLDNLIVGLEPSGGVGPDNSVAVIHDLDEYDILMNTNPAYLSADKDHIVSTPPA